jgi:hypothetical protein
VLRGQAGSDWARTSATGPSPARSRRSGSPTTCSSRAPARGYRYTIDKHPTAGVGQRPGSGRVSPAAIRHAEIVPPAIFTTALNDAVVPLHPMGCSGTPTVLRKQCGIVTPEQFDVIYSALPDEQRPGSHCKGRRIQGVSATAR